MKKEKSNYYLKNSNVLKKQSIQLDCENFKDVSFLESFLKKIDISLSTMWGYEVLKEEWNTIKIIDTLSKNIFDFDPIKISLERNIKEFNIEKLNIN